MVHLTPCIVSLLDILLYPLPTWESIEPFVFSLPEMNYFSNDELCIFDIKVTLFFIIVDVN